MENEKYILSKSFTQFFESEKASGIVLIICTIISLLIANSLFSASYLGFWHSYIAGLSIEHWVNDGVAMTRGVARDCLIDWSQKNTPASGQWRVGGQIIDPARLKTPCFVVVPTGDRIVPSNS